MKRFVYGTIYSIALASLLVATCLLATGTSIVHASSSINPLEITIDSVNPLQDNAIQADPNQVSNEVDFRSVDVTKFPEISVLVSRDCPVIQSLTEESLSVEIKKEPLEARRPSETMLLLDVYQGDKEQIKSISESLSSGLYKRLTELHDIRLYDATVDNFSVYVPTDDGTDVKPIVDWTLSYTQTIDAVGLYTATAPSYTALTQMISRTLSLFTPAQDVERTLIVYTNGVDKITPVDVNLLIDKALQRNIRIYVVFYKGQEYSMENLARIADASSGRYYKLAATPELRDLWNRLFLLERQCRLTYRAKIVPTNLITVATSQLSEGHPLIGSKMLPSLVSALEKPNVTVTLPISEVVGSTAISLTGEGVLQLTPTVTPTQTVTPTSQNLSTTTGTISQTFVITQVTEVFVPVKISWSFPVYSDLHAESIVIAFAADRSISDDTVSNQASAVAGSMLVLTKKVNIADPLAHSMEISLPVTGLPYGLYQVSVTLNAEFGLHADRDGGGFRINPPLLPAETTSESTPPPPDSWWWRLWSWIPFILALAAGLFLWIWRNSIRTRELKIVENISEEKSKEKNVTLAPRFLLTRETHQSRLPQLIGIPSLGRRLNIGSENTLGKQADEKMRYFDFSLSSSEVPDKAYTLEENNGEIKLTELLQDGKTGASRVLLMGDVVEFNKIKYRFFPVRRIEE